MPMFKVIIEETLLRKSRVVAAAEAVIEAANKDQAAQAVKALLSFDPHSNFEFEDSIEECLDCETIKSPDVAVIVPDDRRPDYTVIDGAVLDCQNNEWAADLSDGEDP